MIVPGWLMLTRLRALLVVALLLMLAASQAQTQSPLQPSVQTARPDPSAVTSPQQQFGAAIGDDYFLANYTQLEQYWKRLAQESDRVRLVDIGRTEEGRSQWMAVISAPENLAALDHYRDIARRLALAEGLSDNEAHALAGEGKAVVWIDGGLHANEVLGAQQLIELVYELASRRDPETMRVLRDVIVLAVDANPDGQELVANWYMREKEPRLRRLEGLPRAYQKYVGHDNNRDFYLVSQAETLNMARVMYREWFPQIVLNHHQTAPPGTVMFAPPFRQPFNYVFDPLVPLGIEFVGAAIHQRFAAEGKPGVTMRSSSNYSTWWNGGLRTTAYFHNQIGLLTETIGDPTPTAIPFVADRQLPTADLPFPITPQSWHFRQSVEYDMTANRAVIDIASRLREMFLYNVYVMGRNAIDRGSRDSWTMSPRRVAALREAESARRGSAQDLLRDRNLRDPRGYIIPADQPDFLTATKFVDALIKTGVTVHKAAASFTIGARTYPAGSYVVMTAQAFRPHVLDMFEPQDHPDDIPYPGATPIPPYDNAGWTLAYQMGVKFDRVLDGFSGPFERVTAVRPPPGRIAGPERPAGYLVSHHQNDAFILVNRLLAAGEEVYWLRDRSAGPPSGGTGWIYIAAKATTRPLLEHAATELGLVFIGVSAPPTDQALRLRPVRVGLWDRYGGASTSGWTRWLLERYEFPFELVYPQTLDAGNLANRYDVIILPDEAVPSRSDGAPPIADVPLPYRNTLGVISWDRTLPQLRKFVEDGGTLLTIGDATMLPERMSLPVGDALVSSGGSGVHPLGADEFYIPGSILRVSVDNTVPLGYGFEREVDVFFDTSPAFKVEAGAAAGGVQRVAWYATPMPLRSGWAWGQEHLEGALAAVDVPLGKGRVLMFGPEIVYRGQPHGTFKFLFNGIHYARATPAKLLTP
jgi:hypothetical protein